MGNNSEYGTKERYLSKEEIKLINGLESSVKDIFNKNKNSDGVITLKELKNISKGLLTNSISKRIIKICGSKNDKLTNDDLLYFFALLNTDSFKAKLNFLLDFIFCKKNRLDKKKYIHKAHKFYGKSKIILKILLNEKLINKNEEIEKKEVYEFIKNNFYNEINLYKLYDNDNNLMNISINNDENKDENEIIFMNSIDKELKYCNCLSKNNIVKSSSSQSYLNTRLDKKSKYRYLEKEFKRIEKENGDIFSIILFENMLKELNIIQSLIDIIGNYLRQKSQKCFLNYDLFEELLSKFQINDKNRDNKDKILDGLFELFSYPKDYIKKSAIFLFIKSTKTNISSAIINQLFEENEIDNHINKDKFKIIINYIINDLFESFEHLKYLPYIFFNQDLENKKMEKNCIDILLKGKEINEYIRERIEYDDKFYIIDYKFWKNWNNLMSNNNVGDNEFSKLQLNIDEICDNGGRLKEGLVYLKDYIVLSPILYDLFSKWYKFPHNSEIERERILLYDEDDQKIKINIKYSGKNNKYFDNDLYLEEPTMPTSPKYHKNEFQTEDYFRSKNYEIEIFPIFLVFYKMEDLIKKGLNALSYLKEHMRKITKDKTNFKYNKFSKKVKIKTIIEQLQEYFDNQLTPNTARLWIYFNDKLDIISYEDTLEKHGITNIAFSIIELKQNGLWQTEKLDINKNLISTRNNTPLVGLVNVGNSCYMNSVLQIFFNNEQIKKVFVDNERYIEEDFNEDIQIIDQNLVNFVQNKNNKNGILFKAFIFLLKQKWLGRKKTLNPNFFKVICGEYNESFKEYEQQDAYDFYTFLLDILHEETNIKNNDKNIKNSEIIDTTEEDLGNEYWANTVRNNASYFYALFMGQLQSKLICSKCKKEKIKFEPFNALNLPIPEGNKIIIKICLFRLPLTLSPFYENEINNIEDKSMRNKMVNSKNLNEYRKKLAKFRNIQIEPYFKYINTKNINKNENINKDQKEVQLTNKSEKDNINLNTEFYELEKKHKEILRNENEEDIVSNALILNIPVMVKIEIDKNKKCIEIIQILKNMKELYLDKENIFTEFIIINEDFNIIDNEQIINNCIFPLKEIYIYELLSYEGIIKMFGYNDLLNNNDRIIKLSEQNIITNNENKKNDIENKEEYIIKNNNSIQTLNINKGNNEINNNNQNNIKIFSNENIIKENLIEIKHRFRKDTINNNRNDFFYIQGFEKLETFKDCIILTNKNSIKPFHLYEMIWEKYMYFLDKPYKKDLWWRINKAKENNNDTEYKICSPFMIKIIQKLNYGCAFCPWYKFCTGCILSPEDNNYIDFDSNWIIIVEWCKEIVENEINENNLKLKLYHSSYKKEFNGIDNNKYDKISIYDCLELFTQKEILKDILCEKCNIKTTFTKELKIERLPEYLFIVFKRFKFISKYSTKIENLINFPFEDLKLDNYLMQKNKKNKKYDLYAVINHIGTMTKGHYYCNIKQGNKWIRYEDSYVIEDDDINVSNVYLLVYKVNNKEYYKNKNYDFYFNFFGLMDTAYKIYLKQFNFEHLFNYILNEKEEIIEEFKGNCEYYYGEPVTINNQKGFLIYMYEKKDEVFAKIKLNKGFLETKIKNNYKIKDTLKGGGNDGNITNQNTAICSGCLIN